jgi:NitT/TauT family transport system permease protein
MLEKPKDVFVIRLLKVAGFLIPPVLWEILSLAGFFDSQFVPSFFRSLLGAARLVELGLLLDSLIISLWRALAGLLIAVAVGIPLGLVTGRFAAEAGGWFNPLFRFFAQVNPFTVMPVFILFFGIGEISKIAVSAWVSLWPVYFNAFTGAREADRVIIKTARAMSAPEWKVFLSVILPGALWSIFSGITLGLELSFFALTAAEMIGANIGLGWLIQASYYNLRFTWMYGAIIVTVLAALCIAAALDGIKTRLFFWRGGNFSETEKYSERRGKFCVKDFALAASVVIIIFIAGLWRVDAVRKEARQFGKEGHRSAPIGIFDE